MGYPGIQGLYSNSRAHPFVSLSPVSSYESGGQAPGTEEEAKDDIGGNSTDYGNFSPLLSLPLEILYQIIEIVYYDDNTTSINSNLENFSKTIPLLSKAINTISLRFLYKYANFNRPHSFDKFLQNLVKYPTLGKFVEFMDFQIFTSIGLGRTGRMNQEIQMVTSKTILQALELTPNLIEFLASENIQDDLDEHVLNYLFNNSPKLQALDFCGASSESFVSAFQKLIINDPVNELDDDEVVVKSSLENLFKISFHDCSNLTPDVFIKILPHLSNLRRLDLTHTSVTSTILNTYLPHSIELTHISLAKCSKLTTKDLINFLTNHPSVCNNSLTWLNLQIDSNMVSPLNEVYLYYTLKHLKAENLRYLNLGGLPLNEKILRLIKVNFPRLESLSVSHSSIELNDVSEYLNENKNIRYLDITGCKKITRWNLTHILKANYDSPLTAIEFDYKLLFELTTGEFMKILPLQSSNMNLLSYETKEPEIWKFYDNEGRRSWIYKIVPSDPDYNSILNNNNKALTNANLTFYDLETGEKIVQRVKKPEFLKYASRKINCSVGYFNLNMVKKKNYIQNILKENIWPVEFSQRGIYNYYSLNIK
ncbi:DEHA2E04334p [Debaryomyces hansenii CBS767]|uniref:DEHA2E04334p n=1 Tax=Debaryomyces hansenii (strain ATCC 36239 / CBS 767 / BCRC 21394 / JCM 1990 / NBRC 0083 / IGC 2968) TaxID=284592 RepID=B5RTU9_DEBHA|nr:DEHA2E04334p [Debaryomyces hansenii CBS767]CAR65761.1 DEHA2E04334p [Debaryomyces hansenii CBS767]|eukprot:XP_002770415.1 DEHA2E04334p [Debaryomyces hansenii CBS767]